MSLPSYVSLGDVITEAKAGFACGEEDPNGVFQIRMTNVTRAGGLDLLKKRRVPADHKSIRASTLNVNDVLFNATNSPDLVGKTTLFPGLDEITVYSNHFFRLRTDHNRLFPSYLAHWLQSRFNAGIFKSMCRQWVNQATVAKDSLLSLKIPLLPIKEQRRIVQALDGVDVLRAKRREAITLLDDLSQSIFLDMFGDPFKNDRRWHVRQVAEAGVVQLGRQRTPKYQTGKFTRPYMRVANVHEDRIDLSNVLSMDFGEFDFNKYKLHNEDILLNEGQSTELVGRPAIWRNEIEGCCFQNTLVRFRCKNGVVDPLYALAVFKRYFRTGEFAKISSKTSSVAHLGAARFARMPFPVPPFDVQREFSKQIQVLNKIKANHELHLTRFDALFASLQDRAFCGML